MKKGIISRKLIAGFMTGALLLSGFGVFGGNVKAEEPNESDQEVIEDVVEDVDKNVATEDEESLGGFIASGVDGGVTWSIDDQGFLDVSITGDLSHVPGYDEETQTNYGWPWDEYGNSIKTAKVSGTGLTNADSMFSRCGSLTNIDVNDFDTSNVTTMRYMFSYCFSLVTLDLSTFDTSNVTNMENMFWMPTDIVQKNSLLESINFGNINTVNVTDMNSMFSGCKSLKSLDLSKFDTRNVTDMSFMFYDCSSLKELDLRNFDTGNVKDMGAMFRKCSSLVKLDVSSFDTSNVSQMSGDNSMFAECSSLTSLNLSNFDTSGFTTMIGMFSGCSSLKTLDLSSFDTGNVTTMFGMFGRCSSLKKLNISSFNTKNLMTMNGMFAGCGSITELDLSSFDTRNVTDMSFMFLNCSSLKKLDLSNFDLSKMDMSDYSEKNCEMFKNCSSLKTIKTPKKLPDDKAIKLILPASYLNKSGKVRTEILDTNDIYTKYVPVTGVKLNKTSLKINVGSAATLQATILPTDASLKTMKWSSSNKKVATVDNKGKVKALAKGTTTITVTTVDGSKKATCKVTVIEKQVATITMYRLYNPNSGEHFYSSSQSEIDNIVAAG